MEFVCTLGSPDGRVVEQIHQAASERAVREELRQRGYHIFKIRRRGVGGLTLPSFGARPSRIPAQKLLVFNQELAALLKAGLPILQALQLMRERQKDATLKDVLGQVYEKVESGTELSDAFAELGGLFPPIYAQTLKAGERSGELVQVLQRFVRYQKLVSDARRKVVSALIYPAVLIGLSLLLIVIMGIMVIPKFSDFYGSLDVELPLATRVVLAISTRLENNGLLMAVGVVVGAFVLWRLATTAVGGKVFDSWKLRFPLLGGVFQRMALSEFSRSLSTLLSGGIPLVSALQSSVEAVSNRHIRNRLEPLVEQVSQGKSLHISMESSGVVPDIVTEMTKVGEETGALDGMLTNASDFLDEEVEVTMQRVLALLEPLMLVLMGILLAFLLVAIYLPLFSALGQMQG